MRRACPCCPIELINWSMMPHGTPAKVCSACWHHSAFCSPVSSTLAISWIRVAVATSSAALELRPEPSGTEPQRAASKEGIECPALTNCATTPL